MLRTFKFEHMTNTGRFAFGWWCFRFYVIVFSQGVFAFYPLDIVTPLPDQVNKLRSDAQLYLTLNPTLLSRNIEGSSCLVTFNS